MTYDNRDEGEIRRRAAWLLGMLAVVAALVVVVMVFFLGSSKGSPNTADPNPNYGTDPSTSSSAQVHPSSGATSGSSSSSSSGSASASAGRVPTASCPSKATCTVTGDIAGAVTAINALRAQHNLSPVQASTTSVANTCALSSGSTCPLSYVWVHVDNLSGNAVVAAVQGFSGKDNLLDAGAKQFAIGWAYDPSSGASSCAVILVS